MSRVAVNADGSDERNLTDSAAYEYTPVWSPDGSRIAFAREVGDEDAEIFVMNADGSEVTQVTDTSGANFVPAVSLFELLTRARYEEVEHQVDLTASFGDRR